MNIPKGYKLVPTEPTNDMIEAVEGDTYTFATGDEEWEGCVSEDMARDIFTNMLAAAPTPPQPIYDEAKELESCRSSWEKTGVGVVFADYWQGWLACAQSRAKAGEDE